MAGVSLHARLAAALWEFLWPARAVERELFELVCDRVKQQTRELDALQDRLHAVTVLLIRTGITPLGAIEHEEQVMREIVMLDLAYGDTDSAGRPLTKENPG